MVIILTFTHLTFKLEGSHLVHDARARCEALRAKPELAPEVIRHDLIRELLSELSRRSAPGPLELIQHPAIREMRVIVTVSNNAMRLPSLCSLNNHQIRASHHQMREQ